MTERLRIEFEGAPDGLRRAVSNALRLRERDLGVAPEPIDQRVTITITDQPPPSAARILPMGTTRMRSDQQAVVDPDFKGRLSGAQRDVDIVWEYDDPDGVGRFEDASEAGDQSRVRIVATPGSAGLATLRGTGSADGQEFRISETFEVEGEGIVFAGTTVTVEDQPAPETPAA
jgi:hypothetical protein